MAFTAKEVDPHEPVCRLNKWFGPRSHSIAQNSRSKPAYRLPTDDNQKSTLESALDNKGVGKTNTSSKMPEYGGAQEE